MKKSTILLAALVLTPPGFAQAGGSPSAMPSTTSAKSPADLAHDAIIAGIRERPIDGNKVMDAIFNFVLNFQDDKRVDVGLWLGGLCSQVAKEDRDAMNATLATRIAAALARTDINDAVRQCLMGADARRELSAGANLAAARTKIDALAARYPDSKALVELEVGEYSYVAALAKIDPKAKEAQLRKLASSSNSEIAAGASAELRVIAMRTAPMQMKFIAADGRQVDVAKLRGKVVLVDFWATWCGPCMHEMPNVIENYRKYHAKGFEIVGISFDEAPSAEKPSKNEKSREDLIAFTAEHEMPWPQYYDGKGWGNDFGKMYAIHGIPAMFLLDKEGRLMDTEARGEKLEPAIKKLLGLE